MTRYVEIEPLARKNFEEMLDEYRRRTVRTFRDHYVHCVTREIRSWYHHESVMRKLSATDSSEYQRENRRWRLVREEFDLPALKMGTDDPGSTVTLICATHQYLRHVKRNGKLYAVIRMLKTPRAKPYVGVPSSHLRVLPVAYGRTVAFTLLKRKDNGKVR